MTHYSQGFSLSVLLTVTFAISAFAQSTTPQLCEYRVPTVPQWSGQDMPVASDPDFEDYLAIIEGGGQGGPEPLLYDSRVGVWIDPVSGEAQTASGAEYGDGQDETTGARYLISRGLWVNTETRIPLRNKRLNDVPYFDWETGQSVDVGTGARSDYVPELLTIGQIRQAAYNLRYACLGDDLSQRIDPVTQRYVMRPDGATPDAMLFPTINETNFDRRIQKLDGGRDLPYGFPRYNNFTKDNVRERFDLTNGESRSDVIAKIYAQFAPESPEGGGRLTLIEQFGPEDGLAVLLTATGRLDDAVSAEQVIVFFDTSLEGRTRLMNVGYRNVCGRMGASSAWTLDRC